MDDVRTVGDGVKADEGRSAPRKGLVGEQVVGGKGRPIAVMLGRGDVPGGGAAPPECVIDRAVYLEAVRAAGLDVRETWYEGRRAVGDPSRDIDA